MSANTETTGVPEGYGECISKCGRWAYMCGGGQIHCNACVPSSARYMTRHPDWTPPIAAPAAHIERRKVEVGQRYHHDLAHVTWEGEVLAIRDGQVQLRWHGAMIDTPVWWSLREVERLTLLADAPPEPAKPRPHAPPCYCQDCGDVPPAREAPVAIRVDASMPIDQVRLMQGDRELARITNIAAPPLGVILQGSNDGQTWVQCPSSFGCAHRQHRTVQEAPKAAPVCTNGRDCLSPAAPVLVRVLRDERQPMCDRCYLEVERHLERMMVFESTGKPYAGPERLPKPQLAADWVEECLPEAGR